MMQEMLVMLASVTPEEELLEKLQEHLTQQKLFPSKENQRKLIMYCMAYTIKYRVGDNTDEAFKMMKEVGDMNKVKDMFKDKSN